MFGSKPFLDSFELIGFLIGKALISIEVPIITKALENFLPRIRDWIRRHIGTQTIPEHIC
jgi:hypothetical protein